MQKRRILSVFLLCVFVVVRSVVAEPAGFTPLKIGDQAPDFKLPGVDGKDHSLADFSKAKVLVVVFTCNHCPTAQAYEKRLIQLQSDFKDKGMELVAISPNDPLAVTLDELRYSDVDDSYEAMKIRAEEQGFNFPYLYDGENQKASLAYGVLATPHTFVFDADRKLRYVGRIDDSEVKTVTSHDLRNAVEALLAGKPVPVEQTRIFGCSTKWFDKREQGRKMLAQWDQEPVELETLDAAGITALAKNETDKLTLVNVWATWCSPCIAELPELVTINRTYRDREFRMVTVSIDEVEAKDDVAKVLHEKHVAAKNYLLSGPTRDEFADLLDKEWQGPVPYTLLIAPGGKVIYRKNGELNPLELRRAILGYLGRTYAPRRTD